MNSIPGKRGNLGATANLRSVPGCPPMAPEIRKTHWSESRHGPSLPIAAEPVQPDIQGDSRMGQRPDADPVHPGLGDAADGAKVDAAGRLQLDGRIDKVPPGDGLTEFVRVHVVQEDEVGPGRQRLVKLLERIDFDLDDRRPIGGLGQGFQVPPRGVDGREEGLGIRDWGLGEGDAGILPVSPAFQSLIPNPQSLFPLSIAVQRQGGCP